jgi:hypothetical protein
VGAEPPQRPEEQRELGKDDPQELNVLRQNNVTLAPKGFELSTDFEFVSRRTELQWDHGFLSASSIRYGVFRWFELGLTIPVGYTNRTTEAGLGRTISKSNHGLGDILVQGNARLLDQTTDWPGVVLSLGAYLPTGHTPFNLNGYSFDAPGAAATPNPSNIFLYSFAQGAWGLRSNLQFFKTVDPFILFIGFGLDHFFPTTIQGITVTTGTRPTFNLGFSFAASEKTTLGFTLTGQIQPNLKVEGRDVFQSGSETALIRVNIIQRISDRTYVEPAVGIGLNRNSPDFTLGLGLRRKF